MVEWGPLYAYAYLYNLIYGDTQSSGSASNEMTALPEKDKAPTNTGHPPADLSDIPNHTGNNDGQINIGPNHITLHILTLLWNVKELKILQII